MKHLNFFAKAALGAVFAVCFCFCSCDPDISISEITEDTQVTAFKTSTKPVLKGFTIKHGKTADEIVIKAYNFWDKDISLPAGGFYTFYEDSTIIRTANQHKLKIELWSGNK